MGTLIRGRHRAPWRPPLLRELDPPPWKWPCGTRVAGGVLLLVACALLALVGAP